jgi:D-lactate dehydrogenase (cytochrome)
MQVKTQLEDIQNYLTDASNMPGGHATRLFIPETPGEIAEILREANEQRIAVTISGARTGTVGGAIPFGGYVISMERLNKIVEIDKEQKLAVVQPGVILGDLQKAVEAEGLFYPPDPTEWSCQIGGTVATNASGARSFKYGATRDFVERLNVVLASGEEIVIRRGQFVANETGSVSVGPIEFKTPTYERPNVRKNVSGYFNASPLDPIDLFIGSEGTLGVITEIELRLVDKPKEFFSGIVFFSAEGDLLAFVDEVKLSSFAAHKNPVAIAPGSDMIDASLLEYFDGQALRFISEKFPETPTAAGAIYFEQEMDGGSEDALLAAWNELLEKHNADIARSWFATNDQDREKMRAFRHSLPVSVNERVVKNKQKKIGTDMAVPDENFPVFLRYYKETLDASGLEYVIFGHIGDCHLHANMLPKDDSQAEKARQIYGRCVAHAIMLGGTVSAEHGIGKLKRKYLSAMMGERYSNEMAEIKRAFDPNGILGRGNMFDEGYLV